MHSYKLKLSFTSVVKLAFLFGFCTGIVWMILLGVAMLLGLFPGETPPVVLVLLLPLGCSLLFGLHITIGYPIYMLFNKFTKGITVKNLINGN
ncbi:hypothetical protein [Psychrobium sp. 1_MG-2023]|uniref:hypothetical protein n=1 Tax=Psychrobium sp. 1_MG-2023 TaxID=3062624 RepID=UPI000C3418B8|nr:hypothetical protein [Psychrobium sp. 1_MG-2023]MDP2560109.1 hypothetical protein [Psychrobium sp. 1_MG-2023]PKF56924.1 hypothetical protein CW748_07455 [Alteromonadales bacterium alter-6D02]